MVPKAIQAHCDLLIAFDRFFLLQVLHLILQYSLSIGANCWGNYSKFHIPVYLGQDTSPCSVNLSSLPSRHNRRCPTCTIILNYIVLEHQLCKILTKLKLRGGASLHCTCSALHGVQLGYRANECELTSRPPFCGSIAYDNRNLWEIRMIVVFCILRRILFCDHNHNTLAQLCCITCKCSVWTARTWMIVKSKLTAMFATIGCKF